MKMTSYEIQGCSVNWLNLEIFLQICGFGFICIKPNINEYFITWIPYKMLTFEPDLELWPWVEIAEIVENPYHARLTLTFDPRPGPKHTAMLWLTPKS